MKLALGTVQLGMEYGIAAAGRPASGAILALALEHGVRVLDTAPAYGDAEHVLGELLPAQPELCLVTKTPVHLSRLPLAEVGPAIRRALEESLARLRRRRVYGLLVHSPGDLRGECAGAVHDALRELQASGQVQKVGASVYTAAELDAAGARFSLDLVQAPVSVLDQRLLRSGHLARLHAAGVEVHARSVFLQGVLLADPGALPAFLGRLRGRVQEFQEEARARKTSPLAAALGFVLAQECIDRVVVGVDGPEQLREILAAARRPVHAGDLERFHCEGEELLDPSTWPVQREVQR